MSKFSVTTGTNLIFAFSEVREFTVIAKKVEQKRVLPGVKVKSHGKASQCGIIMLHNLLLLSRVHEYFISIISDFIY